MKSTPVNLTTYGKLRNLLAQCTVAVNPVNWLYSAITDLPLPAGQIRDLAQRLDRHADAMDRDIEENRKDL